MAVEQPSPVKEDAPVEEPLVTQHDRQQVQRSTQQTRDDCLRQLEFYLCDINLPYDAFLKGEMGADGSLACETVANSGRIKQYAPLLTPKQRARAYPLPADDEKKPVCVYARLAPTETAREYLGDDDAFERALRGAPAPSRARRLGAAPPGPAEDARPHGEVVVELEDEAKATALLAVLTEATRLDGRKLVTDRPDVAVAAASTAADFYDQFGADCEAFAAEGKRRAAERTNGGSGQKRPRESVERASGLVLAFDGAKEDCDREALEAACAAHGKVAFVGFQRGAESGTVRFDDAAAAPARRRAGRARQRTWRLLEGAEEADYWRDVDDYLERKRARAGGKGGKGGKGGRAAARGGGKGAAAASARRGVGNFGKGGGRGPRSGRGF
ncbi:hypothetical protein JL721_1020 [Aureococcus anophagefferens]|nr:hypothetical protein JL721_1020 [Aureococcus anophagefferens]